MSGFSPNSGKYEPEKPAIQALFMLRIVLKFRAPASFSRQVKSKYLNTPWITKGIRKSSKRKQRLYEKYLKIRSKENEKTYKTYKNLFERIKKNAKKNYYRDKIKLFENDVRNTWKIMKEIMKRYLNI